MVLKDLKSTAIQTWKLNEVARFPCKSTSLLCDFHGKSGLGFDKLPVVGVFKPVEKYAQVKLDHFSARVKINKSLKPPRSKKVGQV